MWSQLAALLQILNKQTDTVLSLWSKEALEECIKTGTCNQISFSKVCSSLKCSSCGEVIDGKEFYTSCAIHRVAYIECADCSDKSMDEFSKGCDEFSKKDNKLLKSSLCDPGKRRTSRKNKKLDLMVRRLYQVKSFEGLIREEKEWSRDMKEDEKIVYPFGENKKAYWERLLEVRGVPLVPAQLRKREGDKQ